MAGPHPAGRLPVLRVSRGRAGRSGRTDDDRCRNRRAGQAARLLRLQSGPARGARGGHPGDSHRVPCRSTKCSPTSGSWRCWSTRPVVRGSARPSRSCTATFTTRPCVRVLHRTRPDADPHERVVIQIRTPSRLHFGLLGWGPEVVRQFGGIGLMIDSPGIELDRRACRRMDCRGAAGRSGRAESSPSFANDVLESGSSTCPRLESASGAAPASTSDSESARSSRWRSLAAVLKLAGLPDPGPTGLAQLTGRGASVGYRSSRISTRWLDRRRRAEA